MTKAGATSSSIRLGPLLHLVLVLGLLLHCAGAAAAAAGPPKSALRARGGGQVRPYVLTDST